MTRYTDIFGDEHERPADIAPTWRIAGYGVIERDGCLLMVQPAWTAGWTWDLPGGGITLVPEETILDGIVREVHEETGYRLAPDPAALTHIGDIFHWSRVEGYLRIVTFVVRGAVGERPDPGWTRPEGEIARVAWVDPATLRREDVHRFHWDALVRMGLVARAD